MNFTEERTLVATSLLDDVLLFLKENFKVDDSIFIATIFLQFKCGDFASRLILRILEDFGYVSHFQLDGSKKIIKIPD